MILCLKATGFGHKNYEVVDKARRNMKLWVSEKFIGSYNHKIILSGKDHYRPAIPTSTYS